MRPHGEAAADLRIGWLGYQLALHLGQGKKKLLDFIIPWDKLFGSADHDRRSGPSPQPWQEVHAKMQAFASVHTRANAQRRNRQQRKKKRD